MSLFELYQVNGAIAKLIEEGTNPETGELCMDMVAFNDLMLERQTKLEDVGMYVLAKEDDIAALDGRISRLETALKELKEIRQAERNKAENAKKLLVEMTDGEFKTDKFKLSVRKNPPAAEIDLEFMDWAAENAPDLIKTTVEQKPDKAKVREALKDGRQLEYARLTQSVSIKIT